MKKLTITSNRTLFASFGILLFINLLASLLAVVSVINLLQARDNRILASSIEAQLVRVFDDLQDAETAQRGYILTQQPAYLEPYDAAKDDLPKALDSLAAQTMEPAQKSDLAGLAKLSRERIRIIASTITVAGSQGFESAAEIVKSGEGKKIMDQIRVVIRKMNDRQVAVTNARDTTVQQFAIIGLIVGVVSLIITVGLSFFLVLAFRRSSQQSAQLEITNRELARSNSELQDFAYVASHDLQEPLRKIQAFSNLLQDEYEQQLGDGKDYLDRMRNAAERMSSLIGDLLSFSRVTTKAAPFEKVALKKIVDDVVNDLEIAIKETGGKVQLKNLPTLMADPLQMRQLFQNLIGNALKFHRADVKPVIKITSQTLPAKAGAPSLYEIRVTDNGIGFDEKYVDRIFTLFQRLHGRDMYKGTGIGLAICRKIVERHGGTISATSESGAGSTFVIKLPVKNQEN